MDKQSTYVEELEQARSLVVHMEAGDTETVEKILDQLTGIRETMLFQKLGQLTRQLHDTLASFNLDPRLYSLAKEDMPKAKDRLDYVIRLTDEAANRTLTAVETSLPICDEIDEKAENLNNKLRNYGSDHILNTEFKDLLLHLTGFMQSSKQHTTHLRENLSEALIAQEFQDLTGQTVRRVISLVEEVEMGLVQIIKIAGTTMAAKENVSLMASVSTGPELAGPQIPGHLDADAVANQDEVDDLLSSLGF